MSKKRVAAQSAFEVKQRIIAQAERDVVQAQLDAVLAAAAQPAPVAAPAPVVVDPLEATRAEYASLKASSPYKAAEFILNHPELV